MKETNEWSLEVALNQWKGEIGREFEKVCPTAASFKAVLHTLHDIFDKIERDILQHYKRID